MVFKRVYLLNVIFFLLMPITFILTYISAVLNQNVKPVFPYISDVGNWPPESCFFGLIVTIGAFLMAAMVYVRYCQVKELCTKNDFKPYIKKLNTISLYVGETAAFGAVVVANFQETNAFVIHLLGAGSCFGVGALFHIAQVTICCFIYPTVGKMWLNICRAICTLLFCGTLALTGLFLILSLLVFEGHDITKWGKEDGGYELHLISAISEWIMVGFHQVIVVTFTYEFKSIQIFEPKVCTVLS